MCRQMSNTNFLHGSQFQLIKCDLFSFYGDVLVWKEGWRGTVFEMVYIFQVSPLSVLCVCVQFNSVKCHTCSIHLEAEIYSSASPSFVSW